jgi:DHHA1 domain
MDDGPVARKLVSSFDRQFLLYEAAVLAFAISIIRKKSGSSLKESSPPLVEVVENLANSKLPHEIPGAVEYSQEFAENASLMLSELKREGKKAGNFAYVKTKESSTGNVAYALIGAFNVPVGMAYRDDGPENYEASLRATDDYSGDLSKVVGMIAKELNCSGGGHPKASGIRIKKEQLEVLLKKLEVSLFSPLSE